MPPNQSSSAIDVEEHDNSFGVRKTSPFISDGSGNLVRVVGNAAGSIGVFLKGGSAQTVSAPTAASVGITTAQALAANTSRTGLILINTSTGNISLAFGASAVLNSGITLVPNGVFVMDAFTFSTGAVNAIAAIAASNLAIQEYT